MRQRLERRTVLIATAQERLTDAKVLLRHKRYNGAVYLAGYAIECLLKAAVCQHFGVERLPLKYAVHDLRGLLDAAGLTVPPMLRGAWQDMLTWDTNLRYTGRRLDAESARQFLKSVEVLRQWLLAEIRSKMMPKRLLRC